MPQRIFVKVCRIRPPRQQTFIGWNDKPLASPEFESLKSALLSKISASAK